MRGERKRGVVYLVVRRCVSERQGGERHRRKEKVGALWSATGNVSVVNWPT